MNEQFDVIVIGGGPAGYAAAIKAAQLGLKTACVDNRSNNKNQAALGGTCLNVGCIPSKALLESSHKFEEARDNFANHGISCQNLKIDIATLQQRKNNIVKKLTTGIAGLFKANGVTSLLGEGKLLKDKKVEVSSGDKKTVYQAQNVILAPGSAPVDIPVAKHDGKLIGNSTDALAFDEVPKKICVIGAGVIGLELGSVWRRLGSEVVVLEALSEFLPMADEQIAKDAARHLKKQGLVLNLGCKVTATTIKGKKVTVTYERGESKKQIVCDKVIVAVGRKPCGAQAIAEDCGVVLDQRGFIEVDQQCRTAVDGVYAVGDAVRGPMLAHKGTEEGIVAAELIHGSKSAQVNYETIPNVIYTAPEIAWVGLSEKQAQEAGLECKTGAFSFAANGRAMANDDTRGLVKVVSDKKQRPPARSAHNRAARQRANRASSQLLRIQREHRRPSAKLRLPQCGIAGQLQ